MKILTIEWIEDGVECKYVAPVDEDIEAFILKDSIRLNSDFSTLVVRNRNCVNYFSISMKSCMFLKLDDDVLINVRNPQKPQKRDGGYSNPNDRQKYPGLEDFPHLTVKLPPVGVKPRYLHDESRMEDLEGAIERYLAAGATPKKEWLEELEELKRRCGEDRPDIAYHWNTVIDTERCGR